MLQEKLKELVYKLPNEVEIKRQVTFRNAVTLNVLILKTIHIDITVYNNGSCHMNSISGIPAIIARLHECIERLNSPL